jgi:hypothetical protein
MNYYYTAREAQERLGIGVGAFYYLVALQHMWMTRPISGLFQGVFNQPTRFFGSTEEILQKRVN